jgi:hypothetical protein
MTSTVDPEVRERARLLELASLQASDVVRSPSLLCICGRELSGQGGYHGLNANIYKMSVGTDLGHPAACSQLRM